MALMDGAETKLENLHQQNSPVPNTSSSMQASWNTNEDSQDEVKYNEYDNASVVGRSKTKGFSSFGNTEHEEKANRRTNEMTNYRNDFNLDSSKKRHSRSRSRASSRGSRSSSGSSSSGSRSRSSSSSSGSRSRSRSRSRSHSRRYRSRRLGRSSRSSSRSRSRSVSPRYRRHRASAAYRRYHRSPPRYRSRSRSRVYYRRHSRSRSRSRSRGRRYYGFVRRPYPATFRSWRSRSRTRSRSRSRTPLRLTEKDRRELLEIAKANAAKALGKNVDLPPSLKMDHWVKETQNRSLDADSEKLIKQSGGKSDDQAHSGVSPRGGALSWNHTNTTTKPAMEKQYVQEPSTSMQKEPRTTPCGQWIPIK
ncbi:arginine/serine-rich protein 1 [Ambystoma mexicanum]|uniref:arginine/serine-rich protein 1 n=1 Tax=Ambystoma mexicanum TaxID=8296 RepID=UPI0037E81312